MAEQDRCRDDSASGETSRQCAEQRVLELMANRRVPWWLVSWGTSRQRYSQEQDATPPAAENKPEAGGEGQICGSHSSKSTMCQCP